MKTKADDLKNKTKATIVELLVAQAHTFGVAEKGKDTKLEEKS